MMQKKILIVDDDADIRFALSLLLSQTGCQVFEADSPKQCLQLLERVSPDLILLDLNFTQDTTSGKEGIALLKQLVPLGRKVILMTAWANTELVVQGLQLGAVNFIEKPWKKAGLLNKINQHIYVQSDRSQSLDWVAESEPMQHIEQLIQNLAMTDANILILGENGTGKSLLAKRIHELSQRNAQAFEALNMAAIPETLFESELFGHKKGAFTDAKQDRKGAFLRAEKGTLFLDEIGTLPFHLQPKLLQVLENGSFTQLGAEQNLQANVRLISATNQDLADAIEQGQFRQDLYYRINTFTITIPPLRDRKDDILPLANSLLAKFADKYQKEIPLLSPSTKQILLQHDWQGNVRELSHAMERALLLSMGADINPEHLQLVKVSKQSTEEVPNLSLDELEKQRIINALEQHQGQISVAAKSLGISRNALYRRLEKHDLAGIE
ncbi:sigma-54-dependent transcriptional regulator [Parashewanella curva]|nr:sigma-54 dependent transcriptional regulator [Parashewanella curva]